MSFNLSLALTVVFALITLLSDGTKSRLDFWRKIGFIVVTVSLAIQTAQLNLT